jgi:hypothetical protein
MTHFDKLRQQYKIIRLIADEIEARLLAEFRLADARVRVSEISTSLKAQVFGFSSGEIA